MAKQLFRNYNFDFDKNERKMIATFAKQVIKQTEGNNKYYQENKAFNSILLKVNENGETVKLTKDEFYKLKNQLEINVKHLEKKMDKSWFFMKWVYKSLYSNYRSMLKNYFEG